MARGDGQGGLHLFPRHNYTYTQRQFNKTRVRRLAAKSKSVIVCLKTADADTQLQESRVMGHFAAAYLTLTLKPVDLKRTMPSSRAAGSPAHSPSSTLPLNNVPPPLTHYADATTRTRFWGSGEAETNVTLPTRGFARPLELYPVRVTQLNSLSSGGAGLRHCGTHRSAMHKHKYSKKRWTGILLNVIICIW